MFIVIFKYIQTYDQLSQLMPTQLVALLLFLMKIEQDLVVVLMDSNVLLSLLNDIHT